MPGAALYIHIPFCEKKCTFCDFYTVVGNRNRTTDYIQALKQEIALRAKEKIWSGKRFETIFFGGGTPSLLTPVQISEILDCCYSHFNIQPNTEITLEIDPGTVSENQLAAYHTIGVNRFSIGIQSFHQDELVLLDRSHSSQQAIAAIFSAGYSGCHNLNLDFIFALPGQSKKCWQQNLERAVEYHPKHISTYNLTIEPGTPLDIAIKKGKTAALSEEEHREFYATTIKILEQNGFRHYEISNFAQPGYEAKHNLKYWDDSPYLGLGASAHSYDGKRRFWNIAHLLRYIELLSKGCVAEDGEETLTRQIKMYEFAFLGLRQKDGIDLKKFERKFRIPFEEAFKGNVSRFMNHKLLIQRDNSLRLSKEGLFLCDEICSQLEPEV